MLICAFFVPGKPVPKQRARVVRRGPKVASYTPDATVNFENLVRVLAQQQMQGRGPVNAPVRVEIDILVVPPQSWSGRRQQEAIAQAFRPTRKPDASNVLKSIEDGMNGIVYGDDSQIVELVARKSYAVGPGVKVRVEQAPGAPAP